MLAFSFYSFFNLNFEKINKLFQGVNFLLFYTFKI